MKQVRLAVYEYPIKDEEHRQYTGSFTVYAHIDGTKLEKGAVKVDEFDYTILEQGERA